MWKLVLHSLDKPEWKKSLASFIKGLEMWNTHNYFRKSFYFQKKNQFKVLKNIWNVEKLLIIDHKLQHPSKSLIYLKLMAKSLFFTKMLLWKEKSVQSIEKHLKYWKTFDNWSQVAASIKSLDISEINVKKLVFHKNFTLTRKIILKYWKTFDDWSQVASEALKWRTYVVVVGKFQIWK